MNSGTSSVNIQCNDYQGCHVGKFLIESNIVDNGIPQINIDCNGTRACDRGQINVVGIMDVNMNCNGDFGCYNVFLSSALLDQQSLGIFDINCIYGNSVCNEFVVNGIAKQYVDVFCGYGNIGTDACNDMKIYCPIINVTDIDSNWCSIDLGNNTYSFQIYTVYADIYPNVLNTPNTENIQVFCDIDWLYTSIVGTPYNDYCLNTTEITQIQTIIPNQMSSTVNCIDNYDCYIYMTKRNPLLNVIITCPSNAVTCGVVWYFTYIVFPFRICFNKNTVYFHCHVMMLPLMDKMWKHLKYF